MCINTNISLGFLPASGVSEVAVVSQDRHLVDILHVCNNKTSHKLAKVPSVGINE